MWNSQPLAGKKGVILGVANKRSIAWGIARAAHDAGARFALTYESDRVKERVEGLAAELEDTPVFPCDVTQDDQIESLFRNLEEQYGQIDFLVHSIAFAPKEALEGEFVATTREAFRIAHDISAYSLVALARGARTIMKQGGSIVCLTYYGSEKVMPNYNVMGVAKASLEACVRYLAHDLGKEAIRVNAISAGPVNTLAARGISGFTDALKSHANRSPLQRNIEVSEVGNAAVYLLSPLSSGTTGATLFVDSGYNIMGY